MSDEMMAESVRDARRNTLERTIMFTDAAVAIALTLLVLPLVDLAQEVDESSSVGDVLADHWQDFFSFVLSFVVISSLWSVQRALWQLLADYDGLMLALTSVWLLAIVFLPVPTALLSTESGLSATGTHVYLGTLVAAAITMSAQTWWVLRHPQLRRVHATDAVMRDRMDGSSRATFVQLLALGVSFISPVWGLSTLWLLALIDRVPLPRLFRAKSSG
jgi:uncharacterized membrane protein